MFRDSAIKLMVLAGALVALLLFMMLWGAADALDAILTAITGG